jgi:HEAT repeat protein
MKKLTLLMAIVLTVCCINVTALTNSETEIGGAINKIYSNSVRQRSRARTILTNIAKESPALRAQIIEELIKIVIEPACHETTANSGSWDDTAYLLGDLRAEEAIDALADRIDWNDGVAGSSLGHYPAAWALVEIGKPAIPRLTQTALASQNVKSRENAVRALGEIGGAQARTALESIASVETDSAVIFYLNHYLR